MDNVDYTEENIKVLDSIDFSPYLKYIEKGKSVTTFIRVIENEFDYTELVNNDILEGYIFNWLTVFEIVEYFEKRYPDKFKVIVYTEYRFC